MKIVFFGNERIATGVRTTAPTLQALIAGGYTIAAVIVHDEQTSSRKQRQLEIAEVAKSNNIPVLRPQKLKDIQNEIESFGATVAVLVAYGKIIPQAIIDIFPGGIINIHPSLLPLHRGSTPLESALLQGNTKTGVSIMKLSKDMDAGPVYAQSELTLRGNESKANLADTLLNLGKDLLINNLPAIINGSLTPTPQDNQQATYDKMITKDDGIITADKPADQIEKEVRAYQSWPGSRILHQELWLTITQVSMCKQTVTAGELKVIDKKLIYGCKTGSLEILELKPAGKKNMSATAFINGYAHILD